jgi:hypothetical protein
VARREELLVVVKVTIQFVSDGVIGLIGVITGGVPTGSIQVVIAFLHRRNESRTSARLLYGDLLEARDISWRASAGGVDVQAGLRARSAAVARAPRARGAAVGVGVQEFHDVAGAFKAIEFVQLVA